MLRGVLARVARGGPPGARETRPEVPAVVGKFFVRRGVAAPVPERVRTLPQPPIVWGPSEVNEWIRGSFPSGDRGPLGKSRRARMIAGLAVKVWSAPVSSVRPQVVRVLEALGYVLMGKASRPPLAFRKADRGIVVRFHPSLLGDAVTVTARFEPPVSPTTPTKIVRALADEFPLGKVSMTEAARTRTR